MTTRLPGGCLILLPVRYRQSDRVALEFCGPLLFFLRAGSFKAFVASVARKMHCLTTTKEFYFDLMLKTHLLKMVLQ